MTKIKFPKPDYKFWAKKETWSLHQAALLIHGIDPLQNRSVRLTAKNIPAEFIEAQKTYYLLQSIPWSERHRDFYSYGSGAHPVAYIYEAQKKDLSFPLPLIKLVKKRFDKEMDEKKQIENTENQHIIQTPIEKKDPEGPLLSRERRNLLKAIGILVKLLKDEKEKPSRSHLNIKMSASKIAQLMLDKAYELGIEMEGIKSFDRKITEALTLLEEETV